MDLTLRKYREGSYGIISGTPYAVLEELRKDKIEGSDRILAMCPANDAGSTILVAYYTGAKKVLSNLLNWFTFDNAVNASYDDISGKNTIVQTVTLSGVGAGYGTGVNNEISGAVFLSGGAGMVYNLSGHAVMTATTDNLLSQQGTVCVWIKSDSLDKAGTIYDYSRRTGNMAETFYISLCFGDDLRFGYTYRDAEAATTDEKYMMLSSVTTVSVGEWTHVAVTSDSKRVRLFINGVEDTASTVVGTNAGQWYGDISTSGAWTRQLGVSIHSGTYSSYYSGYIDNLRIADFAMTEDQLRQLYESGL